MHKIQNCKKCESSKAYHLNVQIYLKENIWRTFSKGKDFSVEKHSCLFLKVLQCQSIENQQDPFYVVNWYFLGYLDRC